MTTITAVYMALVVGAAVGCFAAALIFIEGDANKHEDRL